MLGFYGLYAKIISIKNNKTPEIFQLVCNEYKIYESYFFIIALWKIMNFITICLFFEKDLHMCVCLIFNPQMSKLPCNIAQEHILPEM